ncbi:hypothetical protein M3J09_005833 [Ascochyta lentis]
MVSIVPLGGAHSFPVDLQGSHYVWQQFGDWHTLNTRTDMRIHFGTNLLRCLLHVIVSSL